MGFAIFISALSLAAVGFVVWRVVRPPAVNHDRCPFRVGLDHIDCSSPCEPSPPCQYT